MLKDFTSKIWGFVKKSLPFIIGLLIGARLTRNKAVWGILIGYLIVMIMLRTLGSTAKSVTKSKNKKKKVESIAQKALDWYMDQIERGFSIADDYYDNFYKNYIFILNVFLFCSSIYFLYLKNYIYFWIFFISLNIIMLLNMYRRKVEGSLL